MEEEEGDRVGEQLESQVQVPSPSTHSTRAMKKGQGSKGPARYGRSFN
jgi:hypothetical protein